MQKKTKTDAANSASVPNYSVLMSVYMYTEVCKYFEKAIERGEKTVPVSVNVSRVTAAQSDFAKFYIETKRKYNIPGGLITIEFTESFAMENYELLAELSNQLHANGIQVSIDVYYLISRDYLFVDK